MERAEAAPVNPGAVVAVGLGITAVFLVTLLVLMDRTAYDTWAGLFIGPVLFLVSIPILARQAAREGNRAVFWFLVFALIVKLAGSVVRHYVTFDVYERADATDYHQVGIALSQRFLEGDFRTGLPTLTATHFIRFFTGVVYTVTRPTRLGGFLVFSWLGFWGLFLFYRAFVLAVPEGRVRAFARVLFFLPSLVYWPSSIGKESWMMFTLGIAAFGAAHVLGGSVWRGIGIAALGLWLAAIVRPHMAGLMALALGAAYLLRRPREDLRQLAPVAKALVLAVIAVAALVLIQKTDRFLRSSGIDTEKGLTPILGQITTRTTAGGSRFVPSVVESPFLAPVAAVTVLFRPSLLEAHNAQAFLAALEGTFLLLFSVIRFRWVWAAVTSIRRQPYVAFALIYVGLFIFAFSGIANFGLLARERVQLFPLYLVLLSVPPRRRRHALEDVRP